ncbi:hypothetical protein [Mesorhizobium sp. A556]
MIFPSNRVRIMVATKPVDFRKGHAQFEALFAGLDWRRVRALEAIAKPGANPAAAPIRLTHASSAGGRKRATADRMDAKGHATAEGN